MSPSTNWYEAQRDNIEACCRQLVAEGVLAPLSTDKEETQSWALRELASLAEGHLHVELDVTRLSEEERLTYERRISSDGTRLSIDPHNEYFRPFWLLADGRRVGTIAIGTMYFGTSLISIMSLYVDPAERRRGIARRALEAVFRAALANGSGGIRLDTHWTWQPAVRFYTSIGMWVRMWKHDLVFTWLPELPPYRVEIGETQARFLIRQEDRWQEVVTARNLGERLGWETVDLKSLPFEMSHCISGTFALHLALAGWPLVRSDETWDRRWNWSDSGEPEGLALKIEIFEAVSRKRGFEIRAPQIPGLRYHDLDEIE
jgi:ribosomal protein S18 acetylase RimI-like enzyme